MPRTLFWAPAALRKKDQVFHLLFSFLQQPPSPQSTSQMSSLCGANRQVFHGMPISVQRAGHWPLLWGGILGCHTDFIFCHSATPSSLFPKLPTLLTLLLPVRMPSSLGGASALPYSVYTAQKPEKTGLEVSVFISNSQTFCTWYSWVLHFLTSRYAS